jgi:hypothetical protein
MDVGHANRNARIQAQRIKLIRLAHHLMLAASMTDDIHLSGTIAAARSTPYRGPTA